MTMSRYEDDMPIRGGKILSTHKAVPLIRRAQRTGIILTNEITVKEGERLDVIAGREFGDARLWWILAATSNIGWCMQIPPGTIVKVPTDLQVIFRII